METLQPSLFEFIEPVVLKAPKKRKIRMKFVEDESDECEFLVVFEPTSEIKKDFSGLKNKLAGLMPVPEYVRTAIAHITLLNFIAPKSASEQIVDMISEGLKGFECFEIELNGAGTFDGDLATLYIEVTNPELILKVVDAIDLFQGFKTTKPHMTIGRHLDPKALKKVEGLHEQFHYEGRFAGTTILVLRRTTSPKSTYSEILRITLVTNQSDSKK